MAGHLLLVTLEAARVDAAHPVSARPCGRIAVSMAHQGYDLQLTRGWRATFYTTGMEHSPTSATGTGWERTTRTRSSRARQTR
jgi:hypothetical protein